MDTLRLTKPRAVKPAPSTRKGDKPVWSRVMTTTISVSTLCIASWNVGSAAQAAYTAGTIRVSPSAESGSDLILFESPDHYRKAPYLARLRSFLSLEDGWDGYNAIPIHQASCDNAQSLIHMADPDLLSRWNIFPATNGTVLLTLRKRAIATVNIADSRFSYVATTMSGKPLLRGNHPFTPAGALDILRQICQAFSDLDD